MKIKNVHFSRKMLKLSKRSKAFDGLVLMKVITEVKMSKGFSSLEYTLIFDKSLLKYDKILITKIY